MKNIELNIETLEKTSLAKAADRIIEADNRARLSFLETAILISVTERKLTDKAKEDAAAWLNSQPEGKTDWRPDQMNSTHVLKSKGVKTSTLENAKPAVYVYDNLLRTGEITEEEFTGFTHQKCRAVYNAMGGKKKGSKVKNELAPETVSEMLRTVPAEEFEGEVECMSTHGCTVEEYHAGKAPKPSGEEKPAKPSVNTPKTGPSYVKELRDMVAQMEAIPPDPGTIDDLIAETENLLDVLKSSSSKVVPIKPAKKKPAAKRAAARAAKPKTTAAKKVVKK